MTGCFSVIYDSIIDGLKFVHRSNTVECSYVEIISIQDREKAWVTWGLYLFSSLIKNGAFILFHFSRMKKEDMDSRIFFAVGLSCLQLLFSRELIEILRRREKNIFATVTRRAADFSTAPIPSPAPLPWPVAVNVQHASKPKSALWWVRLKILALFLKWALAPSLKERKLMNTLAQVKDSLWGIDDIHLR